LVANLDKLFFLFFMLPASGSKIKMLIFLDLITFSETVPYNFFFNFLLYTIDLLKIFFQYADWSRKARGRLSVEGYRSAMGLEPSEEVRNTQGNILLTEVKLC
jgi:hypothetical protein